MHEQELFILAVAIAGVMIVGRAVANRLAVPEAIVPVVGLGVRRVAADPVHGRAAGGVRPHPVAAAAGQRG